MIIFILKIAGGNSTALVYKYNSRNKIIKKLLKEVEQIGFVSNNKLKMAGEELCINATLAFASTLNKKGILYSSGIKEPIIYKNKTDKTIIELPLKYKKKRNTILFKGIGFVCLKRAKITKKLLLDYCNKYNLPAFGIIVYNKNKIIPWVYVKKIDSFVKETACGSGSIAFSIFSGINKVIQPTGQIIKVNIKKDKIFVSAKVRTRTGISQMQQQKVYKSKEDINNNMLPGDPKGSPDESFSNNSRETLVFIDSNFLSKLSRYFGNEKYLIYDLINFSENLSKKQKLSCKDIYYYTAPPFQSPIPSKEEERRKDGYDKFVNKLRERGVIVREGRCQRLKINEKFEYKQKGVDILLAMDLMSVPIKYPKIKKAILIATDSDFVPVINSLKEQNIKIILYTYYEKERDTNFSRSNELIKSVYKYVLLKKEDFDNAPLNKKEIKDMRK